METFKSHFESFLSGGMLPIPQNIFQTNIFQDCSEGYIDVALEK